MRVTGNLADTGRPGCDGRVHSVELTLDESADEAVRDAWDRLTRARLPSQGRHTGPSNRPHVTLALAASMTPPARERLGAIAAELPLRCAVGALLVFGARRFILSRLVVPDPALLDLQSRVVRALDEPVDPRGTFRAGGWTPHITLGRRFTADQVAAALTTLGNVPSVDAAATRMRLWDMATHQESWPARPPG